MHGKNSLYFFQYFCLNDNSIRNKWIFYLTTCSLNAIVILGKGN